MIRHLTTNAAIIAGLSVAAFTAPAELVVVPTPAPAPAPAWTDEDAATFPGCQDVKRMRDRVPAAFVVVTPDGDRTRLDFDAAVDASKAGAWVVGYCKGEK